MTTPLRDKTLRERLVSAAERADEHALEKIKQLGFGVELYSSSLLGALLREAAEAVAVDGWRDIASAPKDGSRLSVYDPAWCGGLVVIARWWSGAFRVGDLPGVEIYPTHWQPLPAAPSPAISEESK